MIRGQGCELHGISGNGECETDVESGRLVEEVMLPLTIYACLGVFVIRWLVQRCDDGGHSSQSEVSASSS